MAKIILLGYNSETYCLYILSDWIQFTQPNNTAILKNFALYYFDLATLLTHIPYSYPYPKYTQHYSQRYIYYHTMQYKSAGHTTAMRYLHARGLTAYVQYTIQC